MEIHLQKVSKLEWALSVIETEMARLRAENELLYEELNRALGSHAPKAWERIAQKLAVKWRALVEEMAQTSLAAGGETETPPPSDKGTP